MDINTLIFNNKNSLQDLKIVVEEFPQLPLSFEEVKEIPMRGRSGTYTKKLHTYKDKKIPFKLELLDKDLDNLDIINDWLNNIKDNRLFYGRDNVYYKVKSLSVDGLQQSAYFFREGKFTVTFVCDPFLYFLDNRTITLTKSNTIINSPNFVYTSLPKLTIYGTGDITIKTNGKQFMLEKVEDYITVDSTLKECYKDIENTNYKMHGKFPILECGKNIITWEGNVTKIEVETNWRCL